MSCLIQENDLALVQFTQDDMAAWAACWQDEVTQRGYNFIPPEDANWVKTQQIEQFPFWVTAVNLKTGEKAGALRLSPDAKPDLAIWIYPRFRGKGWGSRAYKLACDYLFGKGYQELHAGCFLHNEHSRRILEKCGFVRLPGSDATEISMLDGTEIVMQEFRRALE